MSSPVGERKRNDMADLTREDRVSVAGLLADETRLRRALVIQEATAKYWRDSVGVEGGAEMAARFDDYAERTRRHLADLQVAA
jgi:hypothetical protein